jgi:phospholipid/cholesterol/gamma-HCH transport system substrate-binding protein
MIGIVSIVGLFGLAWLLMRFGELDNLIRPSYALTVNLADGAGLRPGSIIELNGVPIGVVENLDLQDNPLRPVRIEADIDEHRRIPSGVEATVSLSLLGGGSVLQLSSPTLVDRADQRYLPSDGSAVIDADQTSTINEIVTALDERMQPILDALEHFQILANTYVNVGDRVEALIAPQTTQQLSEGAQPNLYTAVVRLNGAIDEASMAFVLAQEWLSDEQLRADVNGAVDKAGRLIERATMTVDRWTILADELDQDAQQFLTHLLPMADQISTTLEEVYGLVVKARDGEGTIGKMLNDAELYDSLTDAAIRLERSLADIQLFIQKVREEGVAVEF